MQLCAWKVCTDEHAFKVLFFFEVIACEAFCTHHGPLVASSCSEFPQGVKNSPSCLVQLRHGMLTGAWSLSTRKNREQRFAICAFWKVAEISLLLD